MREESHGIRCSTIVFEKKDSPAKTRPEKMNGYGPSSRSGRLLRLLRVSPCRREGHRGRRAETARLRKGGTERGEARCWPEHCRATGRYFPSRSAHLPPQPSVQPRSPPQQHPPPTAVRCKSVWFAWSCSFASPHLLQRKLASLCSFPQRAISSAPPTWGMDGAGAGAPVRQASPTARSPLRRPPLLIALCPAPVILLGWRAVSCSHGDDRRASRLRPAARFALAAHRRPRGSPPQRGSWQSTSTVTFHRYPCRADLTGDLSPRQPRFES